MIWQKPDLDRSAYKRVMIEPVTIFISPDSEYQGLDADALKQLAAKFQETVTRTLEPEIPTVDERGPGVAYVRAALTNVKLAKKKRGLLSYTPVGLVVTAATSAGGANISLKDAVLEVEMLDSVTGGASRRLGRQVAQSSGRRPQLGGHQRDARLLRSAPQGPHGAGQVIPSIRPGGIPEAE